MIKEAESDGCTIAKITLYFLQLVCLERLQIHTQESWEQKYFFI